VADLAASLGWSLGPKMLTPTCHASRWLRIFPVASGWVLAQAAALASVVKKLMIWQ
jgi:hypothetical protein